MQQLKSAKKQRFFRILFLTFSTFFQAAIIFLFTKEMKINNTVICGSPSACMGSTNHNLHLPVLYQ